MFKYRRDIDVVNFEPNDSRDPSCAWLGRRYLTDVVQSETKVRELWVLSKEFRETCERFMSSIIFKPLSVYDEIFRRLMNGSPSMGAAGSWTTRAETEYKNSSDFLTELWNHISFYNMGYKWDKNKTNYKFDSSSSSSLKLLTNSSNNAYWDNIHSIFGVIVQIRDKVYCFPVLFFFMSIFVFCFSILSFLESFSFGNFYMVLFLINFFLVGTWLY